MNFPTDNAWPYSSSDSASASAMSQIGSSLGSYSTGQGSSLSSMTSAQFSGANQYSRTPSIHGYMYSAPMSRHGYVPSYGSGYGDDATDGFNQQSPPYMLPSQETLGVGNVYGSQDALRTWNPIIQGSKIPHSGLFLDQDSPPSYAVSQLPYLSSSVSRHSTASTDPSAFFPAMGSLVSSLPVAASTGDRTLPNPAAGRAHMQQSSLSGVSHGSSGDASFNYKPGVSWGPDSATSGGSQSSTSTLSGSNTLLETSSARSSTSNAQESAFAYIPMSASPTTELSSTSNLYNTPNLPTLATNTGTQSHSTPSKFPRTSSKESLLQSHNSSSNLYSYSNEHSSKRCSFGDAGHSDSTLVNGQQYTRLRRTQPTESPDSLHQNPFELRSHVAPRASISSIGNARRY